MSQLSNRVYCLEAESAERRKQELLEDVIQVQTVIFEKTSSYTNLVVSVGYAGFFTIWGFLKESMPHTTMAATALSMMISLMFFVFWEVFKAIATSFKVNMGISDLSKNPPDVIEEKLQNYWKKHHILSRQLMPIWRVILILVIAPALVGIVILLNYLIRELLQ